MNSASPQNTDPAKATLALLNGASPRTGLERRMLARLRHPSPVRQTRWFTPRVAASAVGLTTAVLLVAVALHSRSTQPLPYQPVHVAGQNSDHAVAATALVIAAAHPIRPAITAGRHSRRLRTARAQASRVPLPPGVAAPSRLKLRAVAAR